MFILQQVFFALLLGVIYSQTDRIHIQNLDERCFKCICDAATNCDTDYGCQGPYCGPFRISKVFWADAGKVVLPSDDLERDPRAFQNCAAQYNCSKKIITNYLAKYGRDCNEDGVTDCEDFLMVYVNGGVQCFPKINRTPWGKSITNKFRYCNPST